MGWAITMSSLKKFCPQNLQCLAVHAMLAQIQMDTLFLLFPSKGIHCAQTTMIKGICLFPSCLTLRSKSNLAPLIHYIINDFDELNYLDFKIDLLFKRKLITTTCYYKEDSHYCVATLSTDGKHCSL